MNIIKKYAPKAGQSLPAYRIDKTQYSNGGNGKLANTTIILFGKMETKDCIYFVFKGDNGMMWRLRSEEGKIKIKGSEFTAIARHPELGWVKQDWTNKTPIIAEEITKLS
jgi:hypothetical protein